MQKLSLMKPSAAIISFLGPLALEVGSTPITSAVPLSSIIDSNIKEVRVDVEVSKGLLSLVFESPSGSLYPTLALRQLPHSYDFFKRWKNNL